ncbi:MAG TPA: RodZ domain-containing protein [Candidatus Nanopelagicaceae bacterium]
MSLGSTLHQARTSAGLSIDDLAGRTSIRPTVLREFENNDFSKCGGETYARGHLRNLAHALGMDPSIFLDLYATEQSIAARPMYELLLENNVTAPKSEKPRISMKSLAIISGTAVLIVVGGQLIYSNFQSGSKTISQNPPVATSSSTPSASATASASTTPSSSAAAVMVQVTASRGSSWLFVTDGSGATLFSGTLAMGTTNTFSSGTKVNIRFGNAGDVDVIVNGKAIPTPGVPGQVVDLSFGPSPSN